MAKEFIDGNRLASEAYKCAGSRTNLIPGTDGGRIACGYAVRYMIMKAGYMVLAGVVTKQCLDGLPTGAGMASGYYGNDVGQVIQGSADIDRPGNIIFWHNNDSGYPAGVVIHTGICLGNGNAIDNSSGEAMIIVRPCVRSWATIVATCRLYAPESNPGINPVESLGTASGLAGTFSSIYKGSYTAPVGAMPVTTNYSEDLYNSSQSKLDSEKHNSYASLTAIGDYRVRANMEAIMRGVGKTFGGKYYIKSARHTIERDSPYKVTVELSRNAVKDNTTSTDLVNTAPSTFNPSPSNTGNNNGGNPNINPATNYSNNTGNIVVTSNTMGNEVNSTEGAFVPYSQQQTSIEFP